MKKIALITAGVLPVPPVRGGAVENLVQILIEENEKSPRFEFTVYSVSAPGIEKEAAKCAHAKFEFVDAGTLRFRCGKAFRYALNRFSKNKKYFGNQFIASVQRRMRASRERFDAVVLENAPQFAIPVKKAFPRTPLYSHLHNRYIFPGCAYESAIISATDSFLGVSKYICGEIERSRGANPARIFCCYNGIDTERFSKKISAEERLRLRESLGLKPDDFVFVYSGRLAPQKGIFKLLEAFRSVKKERGNARLLVIGASGYAGSGQGIVGGNGSKDAEGVVFTGFVPYEKISQTLQAGDAAVIPSRWEEPFCLAYVECLCAGLPTLITDSGGMPEILGGGYGNIVPRGNGFCERLAGEMLRLLDSAETREKLATQAKKQICDEKTGFTKSRYFERFCEILTSTLEKPQ